MSTELLEKTFTVSMPARLTLDNIRGSVDIRPGADGVITVKAETLTDTGIAAKTEVTLTQEADGTVRAQTHFHDDWLNRLFGSKPCKVNYAVTAPRSCVLQVNGVSAKMFVEGFEGNSSFKTVSGELTVRAMKGSLNFDSVSGEMQLSDLTGGFHLSTVSGAVFGSHLAGTMRLNTVSGDVKLEQSSLPSVSATTVSGELDLATALGEGPYKFNSVSGDLLLKIPTETRCTAELHTLSGGLSAKLPIASASHRNGTQTMNVQGGGVRVYLHSVSGDMEIASM